MLEVAEKMEARVGIEPTHKGFADLSKGTVGSCVNLYVVVFARGMICRIQGDTSP